MGKHNGRARKSGLQVGAALANRTKQGSRAQPGTKNLHMYTTDPAPRHMNSVLEYSDLGEMLDMADLSGRDFAGERGNTTVVISTGAAVSKKDLDRAAESRRAAEERNRHRLTVPRRPPWSPDMTAEAVDAQQRASFLAWRRELAEMEDVEGLILTPFEKNLEVWAQLWRVLERSQAVVQVVDARDPLRYWSPDLQTYAAELSPSKPSLMLLNKADLLPHHVRCQWADYLDQQGIDYLYWSAKAATAAATAAAAGQPEQPQTADDDEDERVRVLGTTELLYEFEELAQEARQRSNSEASSSEEGSGSEHSDASPSARLVVGLTGFPNVGKSSTINALFGSKKTAVAATPGKTKHFQTLNVTPSLTLCDCPGLVLPTYAASKADLVAAGVIPIDRLTDVRSPAAVIAAQVSRQLLQAAYNITLPKPQDDPHRAPTAAELLRAVALARGWVVQQALPDEQRAGRLLLHDFCSGKLPHWELPPGQPEAAGPATAEQATKASEAAQEAETASDSVTSTSAQAHEKAQHAGDAALEQEASRAGHHAASGEARGGEAVSDSDADQGASEDGVDSLPVEDPLDDADLDLLDSLHLEGGAAKPQSKRAAHKFQKKPPRSKGNRGLADHQDGTEGSSLHVGRRGGLVRVSS